MSTSVSILSKKDTEEKDEFPPSSSPSKKRKTDSPSPEVTNYILPESISKIIYNNVSACIKAVENPQWGQNIVVINTKPGFFAYFNKMTGGMTFTTRDLDSNFPDPMVGLSFIYESALKISFVREKLKKDLETCDRKGITKKAVKVLIMMENLLSECHDYHIHEIDDGNQKWSEPMGSLSISKLKKLLNEKQKISKLWLSISEANAAKNFALDFLKGTCYIADEDDKVWDPKWKISDISENEIVVVSRTDNSIRYGIATKVTKKNQEVLKIFVGGTAYKYLTNNELQNVIKYRWS